MSDNKDLKEKLTELLKTATPSSYGYYRMSTRQKIAEGLKRGGLAAGGLYKDTTAQIAAWRDSFSKTGHNILHNKKKK